MNLWLPAKASIKQGRCRKNNQRAASPKHNLTDLHGFSTSEDFRRCLTKIL